MTSAHHAMDFLDSGVGFCPHRRNVLAVADQFDLDKSSILSAVRFLFEKGNLNNPVPKVIDNTAVHKESLGAIVDNQGIGLGYFRAHASRLPSTSLPGMMAHQHHHWNYYISVNALDGYSLTASGENAAPAKQISAPIHSAAAIIKRFISFPLAAINRGVPVSLTSRSSLAASNCRANAALLFKAWRGGLRALFRSGESEPFVRLAWCRAIPLSAAVLPRCVQTMPRGVERPIRHGALFHTARRQRAT